MTLLKTLVLASVASATLCAGAAHAATLTGLFNTGVDALGVQLADGALDSHYLLNGAATPIVYTHPAYIVLSDAKFIAEQANGGYATNPNTYSLAFNLAGFNAASAQLSGFFAADNYATVFLNGHQLAQDIQSTVFSNFQSLTGFSATGADFVSGINHLSVVVTDTGPPSAFAISGLSGTADFAGGVPEPTTWALMLGGFGLAGAALRRRRAATV